MSLRVASSERTSPRTSRNVPGQPPAIRRPSTRRSPIHTLTHAAATSAAAWSNVERRSGSVALTKRRTDRNGGGRGWAWDGTWFGWLPARPKRKRHEALKCQPSDDRGSEDGPQPHGCRWVCIAPRRDSHLKPIERTCGAVDSVTTWLRVAHRGLFATPPASCKEASSTRREARTAP